MSMTFSYLREGEGVPLVLLHGFCESKEVWNPLIPRLSKEAQVIALDFPKIEAGNQEEHKVTIEETARLTHQFLKQELGLEQVILIGHSMGGYVSLAMADLFPEFCLGLCLFHSTAFADSSEKKENRLKTADFLEKHGTSTFAQNFVPSLFASVNLPKLSAEIENLKKLVSQTNKETAVAYTLAMKDRKESLHVLEKADFPCLFIAGKEDKAVPYKDLEYQSELTKNSTLEIFEECGHMGMYEQKDLSLKALSAFIREVSGNNLGR